MQTATFSVFAQSKPKAGDKISGVVSDSEGPMIMVNVTERDSLNRIVAHVVTDIEGNFSFRLVDPDHIIRVTYVGYESVSIPIDTTYFEIKMKERDDLPKVWIISDPGFEKEGNVPFYIPPRDPSDEDLIKIDMSEFESKGMHTIDEVLVGKIPARDLIMAEEMAFADFVEPKALHYEKESRIVCIDIRADVCLHPCMLPEHGER